MTRMQKWESYRHEINQSSQIGYGIMLQTQQIEKYKRAIDRVNPAILQNVVDPELTLHKGVSEVIVSQKQIPNQITRMFKDLSKAKSINNKNNISTILFNLQNESILDQKLKIKDSWLNSNKDYADLSAYIQEINLNKDKEFEKDLQTKFESISKKKQQTKIGVINKLSKDEQKNVGHHVFVISIAIACVFFLLTFVLLLVRWFM